MIQNPVWDKIRWETKAVILSDLTLLLHTRFCLPPDFVPHRILYHTGFCPNGICITPDFVPPDLGPTLYVATGNWSPDFVGSAFGTTAFGFSRHFTK